MDQLSENECHLLIDVFGDSVLSDSGCVMEFIQPSGYHWKTTSYTIAGQHGLRQFKFSHRSSVDGKFIYREVTE